MSMAQTGSDTTGNVGDSLVYPMKDGSNTPFMKGGYTPFQMGAPSNIQSSFQYDFKTGNYRHIQTLGDSTMFRPPNYMTFDQYQQYQLDRGISEYWESKVTTEDEFNNSSNLKIPGFQVKSEGFSNIFGSDRIEIRPSGSAELNLGFSTSRTDNPAIPLQNRRNTILDFDPKIQLNVIGKIGDKLTLTTNYNTEAMFNFENQIKVDFQGGEDDIIQDIEAGNVALPLNSSLITGSQSLFGIKTKLRFGKLDVTAVVSQQEGQKQEIEVQGGAQVTEFEFEADNYDANRHYFFDYQFRELYEPAVETPPLLNTGVNITKIEVWVTNTNFNTQDTRNIIAFQDLGTAIPDQLYNSGGNGGIIVDPTYQSYPDNYANNLYEGLRSVSQVREFDDASQYLDNQGLEARFDYAKVGLARRLQPSEYYFNPQLGYISLNQEVQPNQVLAVAFQYTFRGQTFQVGEFSTDGVDGSHALFLKMIKSQELNTNIPMWDLMMKNVYSLGAYQVSREGFELGIWYLDRERGIELNYIPDGKIDNTPLLQVMGLDTLTVNGQSSADGRFDFLDNPRITIDPKKGRVYFPVLEPFGSHLREAFDDSELGDLYAFDSLYTNTQMDAQVKFPDKNRFRIKGEYRSESGSEISLNAINVPQGSVTVSAGGRNLQENVDYTVDYTLGRVKILNAGLLESGTPIKVSLESNSMFGVQQKSLMGARFDYRANENLILGSTIMNFRERPLTQKTNVGEEPMSNTVVGLDGSWITDAPFLTKAVDFLPVISTKEESSLEITGEVAKLFPGHNKAIGDEGTSYIDDFEGSQSVIDIRTFNAWSLASVPQNQPRLFPEADLINNLGHGFNRARLSWYVIDPLFHTNDARTPDNVKNDLTMQSNHFQRQVLVNEVFPNRQLANNQISNIPVLDLAFYPQERGPYNYDVDGVDPEGNVVSAGVDPNTGELNNPQSRWGGVQRKIETQDFEAANIEYIQFWLMDPFNADYEYGNDDGALYFNLGTLSEDVMRDGRIVYENVLPTNAEDAADLTSQDMTNWGRTSLTAPIVNGFDNDPENRQFQDVGIDGLQNAQEQVFHQDFVSRISGASPERAADPSNDDFLFYTDESWDAQNADILTRYSKFNNYENNSPVATESDAASRVGSTLPNAEDLNRDNVLDEYESYWQYKVDISREALSNVGRNYITDVIERDVATADGRTRSIKWYQFKIPVREAGESIGGISDFRTIRFMRMFMTGFDNPAVMRFARLELVRGEWRAYNGSLDDAGDFLVEEDKTSFDIGAVNIEENGSKEPVNYVLPPEIEREINVGTTNNAQRNEQSISLNICGLGDGKAKAAYRNFDLDVRSYKKIRMFVHGESADPDQPLEDGELTAFVRLGTDFTNNYYEYEIPLEITEPGTYNNNSDNSRRQVWPDANNMVIEFSVLQDAKIARNNAVLTDGDVSNSSRYAYQAGKATIYVVGNPNLSTLKTVMMGIRNPKKTINDIGDDGQPKCVEAWFNELRLTDFDDLGGWAAMAQINSQLADFASVSMSGSISTPGWGSIEKKVSERQRETNQSFDISASMDLGKFLGEKPKVRIPMYVGYGINQIKPQFNPLDPDILFEPYITENYQDEGQQDSIREVSTTQTVRKSVNFTNVRKERGNTKKKPAFYDISNFSASYSFSTTEFRDFETEFDNLKQHRGGLTYAYSGSPKNYRPFSKWKPVRSSKHLRLIRDFNFYLLPKSFGITTDFNRRYNESKVRNNYPETTADIRPFYDKTFNWNRNYNIRYDLSRAIKFDFAAGTQALITEPLGAVDRDVYTDQYELWKDSVRSSIREGGTPMQFNNAFNATWTVPLNKSPITDWISASVRYGSTYNWQRASFAADSLGNTIQNTQSWQFNSSLAMNTLYNKLSWFKEIQRKQRLKSRGSSSRGNQKEQGKSQVKNTSNEEEEEEEEEDKDKMTVFDHFGSLLMMVKTVSGNYSLNGGLLVPGYAAGVNFVGAYPSLGSPGTEFLFGKQNNYGDFEEYIEYASSQDWLVRQNNLNTPWSKTSNENLNFRVSVQPVNDLRIEITGQRQHSTQYSEFYRWYDTLFFDDGTFETDFWNQESPVSTGNYSVSYNMIGTAFTTDGEDYVNSVFETFGENRVIISDRLGGQNSLSQGSHELFDEYADGYGPTQPRVLIPAFLAAYSGDSPDKISLSPTNTAIKPNWRITYTGLTKIPWFKERFKNVTLNHAYRASYNINSYRSNVLYGDDNQDGFSDVRDPLSGIDFVSQYEFQNITLSEQFSPLINADFQFNNTLSFRAEYARDRNLSLSLANSQVTEIRGREYTFGLGYTFKEIKFPIGGTPGKPAPTSDLKTRLDVTIRDNSTIIRKLDAEVNRNEPTAGQNVVTIKFTADYQLNQTLNLRFYFDRNVNNPVISTSFPTANTKAGLSIRFAITG